MRDIGKLWAADTASGLGRGLTTVAGPLLAAALTSDPVQIAGLMVAEQLPWVLFALPAGAIADRGHRRRLMTAASLIRLAALGALGLAVATGHTGLPLLYGVFLLVGCAGVLFENVVMAMVPAAVGDGSLERANGRILATRTLSESLLGPPLGGLLFALAAWLPFAVDAVAFAVVAALSLALPAALGRVPARRAPVTLRAAISDGLRWLWRHRVLRCLALMVAVSNLMLGAVLSILVLLAQQRLGLGPFGYGLLLTAAGVGGIAGGLATARVVAAIGTGTTIRAGLVVETLCAPIMVVTTSPVVVAAIMVVLGMHLVTSSTIGATLRQSLAPPDMLGRVHSAYRLLTSVGMLLGAAAGGLLARQFGLTAPFWLTFFVIGALTVLVWPVLDNATIAAARAQARQTH
ncbi:MFS transporter [Actinophytocola sp.]|uniref:MFS transporter n=1 Tax=Actinophytocola sp. TaxID=1872138 RepID=UPI002D8082A5|nr:MFS transporter [Actinophytocola sp.]HET9142649.1 MFS transporter [Actinophytocola sp.]